MTMDHEDQGPEAERTERLMSLLDRSPVRLPPGVRTRVMARIRKPPVPLPARVWSWLAAPRLSPLAAGVALAAVVAALWLARPVERASATVPVRLVFLAPEASTVAVTGDFARWDTRGVALQGPQEGGVWTVELQLPPGLHHYVFIVNGTDWRPDPNAASQVDDGFGQQNSVLLVPGRRAS
jgi:hypothetical protein